MRAFIRFIRFFTSIFNEFLDKNGPYMAAAVSFYSLFSLFPLLLALIAVFGFFLGFRDFQAQLLQGITQQVPVSEELIGGVLTRVAEGRFTQSIVAAIGLFWASTAVFGSIRKSVNAIWGIKKTRPFLQERAMDFGLMFLASSLLFISVITTTVLGLFENIFRLLPAELAPPTDLWRQSANLVPPLATYATFLILYIWLPNVKVSLRDAWLSALGAATAFEISKLVFMLFLRNPERYADVYGAVGAVIGLLAWVYVSAIILLVGALLTCRHAIYLSIEDQKERLDGLSRNLERIRSTPGMPGVPRPAAAPVPAATD